MAKVAITEQYLTDIADAIRSKTGLTTATYLPSEMAPAIMTISGSGGIVPTGTIDITSNGTYNVTQYASASVNVPTGSTINNQDKSVTPTEASQSITYDTGYTGLGVVTVGAISDTYVGSAIDVNPTISVSGATVTIPSGYYNSQQSKSVATTTHPKPTASVNSTTGLVTASHTQTAGYVSTGTTTGTLQLTTQAGTTITPTDSSQTAVAAGRYTLGAVTVAAVPEETKSITANGTYTPSEGNWFSSVTVNVPTGGGGDTINNQDKTVSPTESQQTITADQGYTGLGTVTVNAISSTYVGSGITVRDSDDLTASGATVSVPAGYYSAAASKSVASGTATAPTSISGTAASVSTGTNTLTLTKTVSVTPRVTTAGYISSGTAGSSSVSLTASVTIDPTPTASGATVTIPAGYYTEQTTKSVSSGSAKGPTSLSGSSATLTTGTNTLTLTKTGVTTTPTVSAGYVSSATASTATVALTASVTTKAAATYYATTSDQTISASQYLTGAQTIKALSQANLSAANIKAGTTISVNNGNTNVWSVAGTYTSDATATAADIVDGETAYVNGSKVTGTLTIQDVYVRSTAPTSSVGNDGDIYIQE